MSEQAWSIPSPPFRPEEALQSLQRELRACGLVERAGVFERRGLAMARVRVEDGVIVAAMVRRPMRSGPEWDARRLASGAQARDFLAELKKRMAQWSDRDE